MTARRRAGLHAAGRWTGACGLLAPLALAALVALAPSGALAGSCASVQSSAEVLERRVLYDSRQPAEAAIRNWTHGDPRAAAEHAFVAEGPDGADRVLQVSYRFGPDGRARAGVRASLGGLDASSFDHLEFRVRGEPAAGFARSFEVAFQRPRPDRPEMMENGSYVVAGVGDQWREVRVPLNLMTGIGSWTGLDEFVIAIDSGRADDAQGTLYFDDVALVRTGQPGPSIADPVATPAKHRWEQAQGGKEAARAAIVARLQGWPGALTAPPPDSDDDAAFLMQVARDTWRGLAALVDREHGLPVDHVTLAGGVAAERAQVGDYTSPSNVGLWLMSVVAAERLGLIDRSAALGLVEAALATLEGLERFEGFFYNYYDTTTLERSTNFVSSVDSSWLTAGLMVVRAALPEVAPRASALIEAGDYGRLYDPIEGLMNHGYYVNLGCSSEYHYGLLYTEARVLSLIAIGKGDVPEAHWFRLMRTLPAGEGWQRQPPHGRALKRARGVEFGGGWYEHAGQRYVPSWGGSMFEALMPTLVVDEQTHAPASLGPNDMIHATLQRRHALDELGYPVWGMSPSATVEGDGYGEFGVPYLGVLGYPAGVVTPHASALALAVTPDAAIDNLRELASSYPIYGEYGFYDAVEPASGKVGYRYLTLDQAMLFIALANHVADGVIQRHFASDPIAAHALPMLAEEEFFAPADRAALSLD
jgi:hypothetical protein